MHSDKPAFGQDIPGYFISPHTLQQLIQQHPKLVVFDVRHDLFDFHAGKKSYGKGHIPTAYFLDTETDLSGLKTGKNGRHPLPEPEVFAQTMAKYGVTPETFVVVYDSSGGTFAAHLWWMLRWIGHYACAVLDGGWQAWESAGFEQQQQTPVLPEAHPSNRNAALPAWLVAKHWVVPVEEVVHNLAKPVFTLLDARTYDRFAGVSEPIDPVAGHIPGSLQRFHLDNLDAHGFIKTRAQLRHEFTALLEGINPANIVHTCGSGVTACHNLMVMDMIGFSTTRLYAGSWSEWCADPARPCGHKRH